MMFSSSNSKGDNGCFQLGSSSYSPELWEDYDQFFMDHFLGLPQEHQQYLLGHHENDPDNLTLVQSHGLVDEMMVSHNFDGEDQICCDMEKERVSPGQTKAIGSSSNGDIMRPAKRIRYGKKDRHSKICTAQGPRERRMRLSLKIASKFFDLQDKLGFDKASKTIEWLLNESKNAIKEVMENACYVSKTSYVNQFGSADNVSCENGRKNEDAFSSRFSKITTDQKTYDYKDSCNDKLERKKKQCRTMSMSKTLRNNSVSNWSHLKKDVRDKARARARERTVEKTRLRALNDPTQGLITTWETAASANNPSDHIFSEHVNSGAISQPVSELIQAVWENENARIYSTYFFDGQSPDTISFASFASQMLTNQLCLSTATTTSSNV